MGDHGRELETARLAKSKALEVLPSLCAVRSIGITRRAGRYAVKVNLEEEPESREELPAEIDGVPLVFHVVGKIRKQER